MTHMTNLAMKEPSTSLVQVVLLSMPPSRSPLSTADSANVIQNEGVISELVISAFHGPGQDAAVSRSTRKRYASKPFMARGGGGAAAQRVAPCIHPCQVLHC